MAATKRAPTTWKHDGGLIANFVLSLLVGPLPVNWRRAVEDRLGLSANFAGVASGLLQLIVMLGLWVLGYLLWFKALDAEMTAGARRLAETGKYDFESYSIIGAYALAMSPLLTIYYSLTTITGLVTALGTFGGFTRLVVAAATSENYPDPTLNAIEWTRQRLTARGRAKLRARAKGDESPDRLEMGEMAADGYDLRITTARDLDWREGNSIIVAGESFFLVDTREIRDDHGRLRIRHALRRLKPGEIVRAPKAYRPESPPEIVTR